MNAESLLEISDRVIDEYQDFNCETISGFRSSIYPYLKDSDFTQPELLLVGNLLAAMLFF